MTKLTTNDLPKFVRERLPEPRQDYLLDVVNGVPCTVGRAEGDKTFDSAYQAYLFAHDEDTAYDFKFSPAFEEKYTNGLFWLKSAYTPEEHDALDGHLHIAAERHTELDCGLVLGDYREWVDAVNRAEAAYTLRLDDAIEVVTKCPLFWFYHERAKFWSSDESSLGRVNIEFSGGIWFLSRSSDWSPLVFRGSGVTFNDAVLDLARDVLARASW